MAGLRLDGAKGVCRPPHEPLFSRLINPHFAALCISHCELCGKALLRNALQVASCPQGLGPPVAGKDPTPELKL